MQKLHETTRFQFFDLYCVVGRNPDDDGGGIIGTARTIADAHLLQIEAIKQNYTNVRVMTWKEMNG